MWFVSVAGQATRNNEFFDQHQRRVAAKIAQELGVSLDYLVGNTDLLLDADIIKKIQKIQKLKPEDKNHVFALLDAFLKQTKIHSVIK